MIPHYITLGSLISEKTCKAWSCSMRSPFKIPKSLPKSLTTAQMARKYGVTDRELRQILRWVEKRVANRWKNA